VRTEYENTGLRFLRESPSWNTFLNTLGEVSLIKNPEVEIDGDITYFNNFFTNFPPTMYGMLERTKVGDYVSISYDEDTRIYRLHVDNTTYIDLYGEGCQLSTTAEDNIITTGIYFFSSYGVMLAPEDDLIVKLDNNADEDTAYIVVRDFIPTDLSRGDYAAFRLYCLLYDEDHPFFADYIFSSRWLLDFYLARINKKVLYSETDTYTLPQVDVYIFGESTIDMQALSSTAGSANHWEENTPQTFGITEITAGPIIATLNSFNWFVLAYGGKVGDETQVEAYQVNYDGSFMGSNLVGNLTSQLSSGVKVEQVAAAIDPAITTVTPVIVYGGRGDGTILEIYSSYMSPSSIDTVNTVSELTSGGAISGIDIEYDTLYGGYFLAIAAEDGTYDTLMYFSSDNDTWTRQSLPNTGQPMSGVDQASNTSVRVVAFSSESISGAIYYSNDGGTTWLNSDFGDVASFATTDVALYEYNGTFIAAFAGTLSGTDIVRIWTSPNGEDWTMVQQLISTTGAVGDLKIWYEGSSYYLTYIGSDANSSTYKAFSSIDATTWNQTAITVTRPWVSDPNTGDTSLATDRIMIVSPSGTELNPTVGYNGGPTANTDYVYQSAFAQDSTGRRLIYTVAASSGKRSTIFPYDSNYQISVGDVVNAGEATVTGVDGNYITVDNPIESIAEVTRQVNHPGSDNRYWYEGTDLTSDTYTDISVTNTIRVLTRTHPFRGYVEPVVNDMVIRSCIVVSGKIIVEPPILYIADAIHFGYETNLFTLNWKTGSTTIATTCFFMCYDPTQNLVVRGGDGQAADWVEVNQYNSGNGWIQYTLTLIQDNMGDDLEYELYAEAVSMLDGTTVLSDVATLRINHWSSNVTDLIVDTEILDISPDEVISEASQVSEATGVGSGTNEPISKEDAQIQDIAINPTED